MIEILKTIWETFKTGVDCYIIWVIGPDGILFDLLSILKIIGSGLALLVLLYRLIKNSIEWQ